MNSAANRVRIGRLSFRVTVVDGKTDCGRPVYELTGVRGAKYRTMRNVHGGWMFLIHAGTRGFGMASAMRGVRLSDAGGALAIL